MQGQELDSELEFERNLSKQRNKDISEAEQSAQRIHGIVTDMAGMVDDQGKNIDIIGEEMLKAHDNVESANDELDRAASAQNKARKKYIILVAIIIFVAAAGTGAFFILH